MSHMVIYRGSDGKPGYHQTDDIHDAVGYVEQMRNEDGVEHARIFRLEEVVFQYKPYYRVELAEGGAAAGEIDDSVDSSIEASSDVNADEAASNGNGDSAINGTGDSVDAGTAGSGEKKGLFGR